MSEDLKPCPFCGDYPSYGTRVNGGNPSNYCYCYKCMEPKYFEKINQAIDAWNTRFDENKQPLPYRRESEILTTKGDLR